MIVVCVPASDTVIAELSKVIPANRAQNGLPIHFLSYYYSSTYYGIVGFYTGTTGIQLTNPWFKIAGTSTPVDVDQVELSVYYR